MLHNRGFGVAPGALQGIWCLAADRQRTVVEKSVMASTLCRVPDYAVWEPSFDEKGRLLRGIIRVVCSGSRQLLRTYFE